MEGVQPIVEKILSDAREEAKARLAQARGQAEELIALAHARAAERRESSKCEREAQGEALRSRMMNMAGLERAKLALDAKRARMDDVYVAAREKLLKLPEGEYRAWMARLIRECAQPGDEVVLARGERRLDASWLAGCGVAGVRIGERTHEDKAGFVLLRGGVEVNATLGALIAQVRESSETDVARLLFTPPRKGG